MKEKEHRKELLNIIDYSSYFLKHDDMSIEEIVNLINKEMLVIQMKLK